MELCIGTEPGHTAQSEGSALGEAEKKGNDSSGFPGAGNMESS